MRAPTHPFTAGDLVQHSIRTDVIYKVVFVSAAIEALMDPNQFAVMYEFIPGKPLVAFRDYMIIGNKPNFSKINQ